MLRVKPVNSLWTIWSGKFPVDKGVIIQSPSLRFSQRFPVRKSLYIKGIFRFSTNSQSLIRIILKSNFKYIASHRKGVNHNHEIILF